MVVRVGVQARGNAVVIQDPDQDTKAGEIYRATLEVSGGTPNAGTLLEQFILIKNRYPAISITYVEIQDQLIIIEFYDHPVVPLALVIGAVIAAILVIGLVVVRQIVELIVPVLDNPVVQFGIGVVLIAGGVAGLGYALSRYYGVKRGDYRRAGTAVKTTYQKARMRLRR